MQQRNNFIVAVVFLVAVFLATIPLDWLKVRNGPEIVTITGWHGTLDLAGTAPLPIWLLIGFSTAATVVAGLNYVRVTTIPFLLPVSALFFSGAYYLCPLLAIHDAQEKVSATPGLGLLVALAATGAAFVAALLRPLPVPLARPDRTARRTTGHPLPAPAPASRRR